MAPRRSRGAADVGDPEALVHFRVPLEPRKQSQLSILLRPLVAFPYFLLLILFEIAAVLAVIRAWFSALLTGRVPEPSQALLTGFLRYYANFLSFTLLVTRPLPKVVQGPDVVSTNTLEVDHVTLNRIAILFRLLLCLPAVIVGLLLLCGAYLMAIVAWVIGSVTGRVPRSMHQAFAVIIRFVVRATAYSLLLVPTQPFREMFGGTFQPSEDENDRESDEEPSDSERESVRRMESWIIDPRAQRLVGVALIVGILAVGTSAVLITLRQNNEARASSLYTAVSTTFNEILSENGKFVHAANLCHQSGPCVADAAKSANTAIRADVATFQRENQYPSRVLQPYQRFVFDLLSVEDAMGRIAATSNPSAQHNFASVINSDLKAGLYSEIGLQLALHH